jgi:hypothetical protein
MFKRVAISVLFAAALFGAVSTGFLAKHRALRGAAVELAKLDVHLLVGD